MREIHASNPIPPLIFKLKSAKFAMASTMLKDFTKAFDTWCGELKM
jgi:hypothetical protein